MPRPAIPGAPYPAGFMRMRPVLGPILMRPGAAVDSLPE